MFNIIVDYPSYEEEVDVVKTTTSVGSVKLDKILDKEDILDFQLLVRKIPIPDNVLEYAVSLANKTRPGGPMASDRIKEYVSWGAGPRASQFLVMGAKCNAVLMGKYSPDIEDVKAVATPILRHRIIRNYKAEAEGISVEDIINSLL
jgi:MoxR-like ATPase